METDASLNKRAKALNPSKGKGKQPKRFLEKNDALQLAASIASIQEEKSRGMAEKHRNSQPEKPIANLKPRISASKLRLKETKARLAVQRAQAKKEKIKIKKHELRAGGNPDPEHGAQDNPEKKPGVRKKVSFA